MKMRSAAFLPLLLTLVGVSLGSSSAGQAQTCETDADGAAIEGQCTATTQSHDDLPVGTYWRPPAAKTTGFPGKSEPYKRSPCPALNALANHGYLPRTGTGLTVSLVAEKLKESYNLDWKVGAALALVSKIWLYNPPWSTFTLADLGTHNVIEHDASLFHYDAYTKRDPSEVDVEAVKKLISMAKDGVVDFDEFIKFRELRTQASVSNNPEFRLSTVQKRILSGESSLFLTLLGRNDSISTDHLKRFVLEEKIPDDYVPPSETYTAGDVRGTQSRVLSEDKVLAKV